MCGATKLVYKLVQTSPFLTRSRLLFEFVITVVLVFLSFFFPFSLLNAHTLPGKLLFGFISFCCCCCLQPVSFSRAYFHPTSFRLFIFYFFAIKKKIYTDLCAICASTRLCLRACFGTGNGSVGQRLLPFKRRVRAK